MDWVGFELTVLRGCDFVDLGYGVGRYRLVRRCHLVIHFIRCVNGLRECLSLKASREFSPFSDFVLF